MLNNTLQVMKREKEEEKLSDRIDYQVSKKLNKKQSRVWNKEAARKSLERLLMGDFKGNCFIEFEIFLRIDSL